MKLKALLFLVFIIQFANIGIAQNKNISNIFQLDSILKANVNVMKQINMNDIDMIMLNDCNLNEIEYNIEMLKNENIASHIDFKKKEEIAVYEHFTEISNQANQLRVILNQYISNLDFWYYKKAMECLSRGDSINTLANFNKSLLFNPYYIPALYQKSMLFLGISQTNNASAIAQFISTNLYPNGNDFHLINALNEQISKQFKTRGERFLKTQYYNESLELFMQADTFCKFIHSNDCEYFKNGIQLSIIGLYHSYLRVAEQAMETQNYTIAENFVMKARSYALINRNTIKTDEESDKFLKRIVVKYIELSVIYKHRADYKQSESYLQKVYSICGLIKDNDCEALINKKEQEVKIAEIKTTAKDTVAVASIHITEKGKDNALKYKKHKKTTLNKIKPASEKIIAKKTVHTKKREDAVYSSLIEMGNDLTNENRNEEALEKYLAAKERKNTVLKSPAKEPDSLISITAVNIIESQLKTANFLIWANEFAMVDSMFQNCVRLQHNYHLENDGPTNKAINAFNKKITAKKCQNIQDEIEQLNNKCNNYIALKDFEKVQLTVNEADNLLKTHTECDLSSLNTLKLKQLIKPVTTYFSLKENAKKALEKQDKLLFCHDYTEADALYHNSRLDTLGIPDNNIIAYINFKSDEELMLYTADYFIGNYNFNNCLSVLKLLKEKGTDAVKTKALQQALAQKQYNIDKPSQNPFDKEKQLKNYTADDKWFRYFNTEYRKSK
ncbi:MAG: hypothetical protein NTZ33_00235 [Bacteroidetes bacterium]|nr:hypothetical protein [Bacteroidota bacterium]